MNTAVSGLAVFRQAQRYDHIPATSSWQQLMDEWYPDAKLEKIFPSMVRTD